VRAKGGAGGARVAGSDSTGSPARAREVGGDPDRRAPPVGGLREGKAGTGWAGGRGFGPRKGNGPDQAVGLKTMFFFLFSFAKEQSKFNLNLNSMNSNSN